MPQPYNLLLPESAIFHKRGVSTPPCGVPLFTSLVLVEVHSVAVKIQLINNLWISLTIGGSTPSSVRDSVIAVGSTLLKAPSISSYLFWGTCPILAQLLFYRSKVQCSLSWSLLVV